MEDFRKVLNKVKVFIDNQDGVAENQLKELWNNLSDAITKHEKELAGIQDKADRWDALGIQIMKCYCNAEGEYDEDNPEIEGADLCTIGEMAATAYEFL